MGSSYISLESSACPMVPDGMHMAHTLIVLVSVARDLAQGKCWERLDDRRELQGVQNFSPIQGVPSIIEYSP